MISFRIIPPLDTYPGAVCFAQTGLGKACLLAAFSLALYLHGVSWWKEATFFLLLPTFRPGRKNLWLCAACFVWLSRQALIARWFMRNLFEQAGLHWNGLALAVLAAAALASCAAVWRIQRGGPAGWTARRPLRNVLAAYLIALVATFHLPLPPAVRAVFWVYLLLMYKLMWPLGFALLDRSSPADPGFVARLGMYPPFWAGYLFPIPLMQASSYLRKVEARGVEELAVTQLKALKLVYWAYLLAVIKSLALHLFYGSDVGDHPGLRLYGGISWVDAGLAGLHWAALIPSPDEAVLKAYQGVAFPWHINWLSQASRLLVELLFRAVEAHVLVAAIRMAGYRIMRNVYRPLESAGVFQFWTRYNYYFKELILQWFFYPAFFRYFRDQPKKRVLFALFASVGFGNFFVHYLANINSVIRLGPWAALVEMQSMLVYLALLNAAIAAAWLQDGRRDAPSGGIGARIRALSYVVVFFCVATIFDEPFGVYKPIGYYIPFVISLFRIF